MARPKLVPDAEVLAATAEALGALGPAGLTLAAVGARCGLSAAAVQRRFGSKQALLRALCHAALEAWPLALAEADAAHPEDPLEAALVALCAPAAQLGGPRAAARHLATLADDLQDPERAALVRAWYLQMEISLAERLAEAVRAGALRKHDPQGLAQALVVLLSGALVELSLRPVDSPTAHVRDRLEALMAGVRA